MHIKTKWRRGALICGVPLLCLILWGVMSKKLPIATSSVYIPTARRFALARTLAPLGIIAGLNCVSFSPDGTTLASAGDYMGLWNVASGQLLWRVYADEIVNAVAFSPDGKTLASGGYGGEVWDVANGKLLRSLPNQTAIFCVAFSPDGKVLVNAGGYGVQFWDTHSWKLLSTIGDSSAMSIAFSPDGKLIALSAAERKVAVWNWKLKQMLWTVQTTGEGSGPGFAGRPLAFSPDGQIIANEIGTGPVELRDARTGALLRTLQAHQARVLSMAFSPDSKLLATSSESIKLWDTQTGILLATLKRPEKEASAVTFSPDGKMLAGADSDGTVKLWNVL